MVTIKKKGYATKKQTEPQIMSIAHKAAELISLYRMKIVIAASAVAAALVIIAVYSAYRHIQERSAAPLLASAYDAYRPGGGMTDYGKAFEMFSDVRKKYPGTMSGAAALYYMGNCLVDMDRKEDALKEYRNFIDRYSGEKLLLGLVHQRMGYLYSSMGSRDEAVKSFEKSEALLGTGLATVELARIYDRELNAVEAQKRYKQIAERLSGTPFGFEAMGKLPSPAPPAPTLTLPEKGKESK